MDLSQMSNWPTSRRTATGSKRTKTCAKRWCEAGGCRAGRAAAEPCCVRDDRRRDDDHELRADLGALSLTGRRGRETTRPDLARPGAASDDYAC